MNPERLYLGLCWLPPALYGMALYVVEQYDGWGQWAAAPLLLPPLVICVAWLAGGAALVWKHEGDPGGRSVLAGAALLGGSPALLLLFRAVTS